MKKVLLKSMLLLVATLFAGISYAQTVTGTVTEESGPLPGANVVVKGTSNGATTDFDGNYTLNNVASDAVLVFSYVGYASQEVAVAGRSTVNVAMAADNALEEVILIGYGQTTIKDATGSVSAVTSEDFVQGVISSPEQLIQGKTAGVQISETSGQPGAGVNFNIRGNNSIRSGNNPLFVVDGVPLAGGGAPATGVGGIGNTGGSNPLNFLNPNDIESISILKDASATAIYGSRGANGVVIVQTKGGRGASKGVWELNTSVSQSKSPREYDLLNRQEFLTALDEFVGRSPEEIANIDQGADSDFQDFYTRTAYSRQTDLSYSKSYNGGNMRASLSYGNQNGIVISDGFERLAGRLNISQRFLDDKLKLSFQGSASRVNDTSAPLSGSAGSTGDLIGASISANPTLPINPDADFGNNLLNPVNLDANFFGISNVNRYLGNLSLEYDLTSELSAKVTGGIDYSDAESTTVFSPNVIALNGVSGLGRSSYAQIDNINSLLEATLNYKKDFGNVQLDVVAGYSYQKFDRNGVFANGAGLSTTGNLRGLGDQIKNTFEQIDDQISGDYQQFGYDENQTFVNRIVDRELVSETFDGNIDRGIRGFFADTFDNFDELQSGFLRANATINNKFLLTGTFRADGSSTFGSDNQYGYFPSGAVAWKLSEEDFVGDNVSTLKLRLGAGVVGSQEGLGFANFLFRTRFGGLGINNDGFLPEVTATTAFVGNENPALKWEETSDFNIGVDFGFNNDRLNGSFNLFRKETNDLLLRSELAAPQSANVTTIFRNLDDGTVVNQGVEFSINYDFIQTEDWGFNVGFNIAYIDNEVIDTQQVIDFGPINGNGLTGAFVQRLEAGQPLFSYYVAQFTGFDADGNPTYRDLDGNGVGDPDSEGDRSFVGKDAVADWTAGLNLTARYKNFDLSAFFNSQFDFYVYNATDNAFFTAGGIGISKNVTQDVINSNESPSASVSVSDRFLEKGDFIRLQNLSLGYNWPLSGEGFLDSLRLSASAQNVFLITDYSGLDPEVTVNTGDFNASAIPTRGIDYASYPRPRTFTLGVNARF